MWDAHSGTSTHGETPELWWQTQLPPSCCLSSPRDGLGCPPGTCLKNGPTLAKLHTAARTPTKLPGWGGSHQSPVHKTRPESPLGLRIQPRSKKTKTGSQKSPAGRLHSDFTALVPQTWEQPEAPMVLPRNRSVLHGHQGALQAQGFLSLSPAVRPMIPHLSHWGASS